MLRKYVGFYWTLPVIREDFLELSDDAEEAAKESRTIRYQRQLVLEYLSRYSGELVKEFVYIDIRPDRATEYIYGTLGKACRACDEHNAKLLYVDFKGGVGWRPIPGIREYLEAWGRDRAIALCTKRLRIDNEEFDPAVHFRQWRERDRADMAKLARAADKGLDDALRQFPDRQWTNMADWLNDREIKTYNGRAWTPDNVRKAVGRRDAGGAGQLD